jgi:hypothetical protein
MATTFTTRITAMYTLQQPDPNYVVNVFWEVTGVDGTYTSFFQSNTQFNSADQVGAFIPYDQLTEATVIGWIPVDVMTNAQNIVQGQINNMINPPVSPERTPLPWTV